MGAGRVRVGLATYTLETDEIKKVADSRSHPRLAERRPQGCCSPTGTRNIYLFLGVTLWKSNLNEKQEALWYLFTADAGVGAGQKRPPRLSYSACSGPGRQSVRELGERVERLEGELGRLNMENADLKSQLKERDARIAKLESVLEESRGALASAKPHPSPRTSRNGTRRSPDASRGLSTGGRPSERSQFPTRPSRLRARSSARAEVR